MKITVKITAREKRFLIIGGSVCVVFLLWFFGTPLLPGLEDLSTSVDFKRRMLQRQKETLNQRDVFGQRVERYQRRWEENLSRLLEGENASIAAAEPMIPGIGGPDSLSICWPAAFLRAETGSRVSESDDAPGIAASRLRALWRVTEPCRWWRATGLRRAHSRCRQ